MSGFGADEATTDANNVTLGTKKYYSITGMTVAMNPSTGSGQAGSGLQYFLTDHLGSVVAVTNASGTLTSQQRYLPFGQTRTDLNGPRITSTDFGYTGQRNNSYINLLDYNSRWYSDQLGRFISPDSIVPDPSNPQSFNRYSYVLNNPINATDPSGNKTCRDDDYKCSGKLPHPIPPTGNGGGGGSGGSGGSSENGGSSSNPQDYTYHLHSDINLYQQGLTNFSYAWSIYKNPYSSILWRTEAGLYMGAWGGAHVAGAVGVMALAWQAVAPAAGVCVASAKCEDDVANEIEQGVTVIGRYPANKILAQSIGGSWLNVQTGVWDSLGTEEAQWALNKQWLQDAISRGDVIRLASDITEAAGSKFFAKELEYLTNPIDAPIPGLGYTFSLNGQYLIPPLP